MVLIKKPNTIPNGPELWDAVLEFLKPYYAHSIVAGGCVRDYLLGIPPKDIDVFCRTRFETRFLFLDSMVRYKDTTHKEYQANIKSDVLRTYEFNLYGQKINLIHMNVNSFIDVMSLTETFDFNICRSGYEGKQIYDNPLAKIDRKELTFSVNPKSHNVNIVRFERIQKRMKKLGLSFELARPLKGTELHPRNELPYGAKILELPDRYLNKCVRNHVGLLGMYRYRSKVPKFILKILYPDHWVVNEELWNAYTFRSPNHGIYWKKLSEVKILGNCWMLSSKYTH